MGSIHARKRDAERIQGCSWPAHAEGERGKLAATVVGVEHRVELGDNCNAPIPQVRGRYGDVHTQGEKPSRTYAKP